MGLFKKKFQKNVTRDNEFLKNYAIKVNGLLIYTEKSEKVTEELKALMNDFQYTVASAKPEAKKIEKNIAKTFEELTMKLEKPDWDEEEVLLMVRTLRRYIIEIGSLR